MNLAAARFLMMGDRGSRARSAPELLFCSPAISPRRLVPVAVYVLTTVKSMHI